jgi:transposase
VKELRQEFEEKLTTIDVSTIFVLDEAGANLSMTPTNGRAQRGKRAHGVKPTGKRTHLTIVAALALTGFVSPMLLQGTMNTDAFEAYLEKCLLPELPKNSVLIMDNFRVHHVEKIKNLIESRGVRIIYLPPYSPQLSPIEKAWFIVKNYLRKKSPRLYDALVTDFQKSLDLVTPEIAKSLFSYIGAYNVNKAVSSTTKQ